MAAPSTIDPRPRNLPVAEPALYLRVRGLSTSVARRVKLFVTGHDGAQFSIDSLALALSAPLGEPFVDQFVHRVAATLGHVAQPEFATVTLPDA